MHRDTPTFDPLPATYMDEAGREHHVIVRRAAHGGWRVLDVLLVETLTGCDDGEAAADALARDYARQHNHARRIAA